MVLSQSVAFVCGVEGTAPLQLQWLRGSSLVEAAGSRVQLTNGSLSISSVERGDKGSYTCRAVFTGGVTESEAYLDVLGECVPACMCQCVCVNMLQIKNVSYFI